MRFSEVSNQIQKYKNTENMKSVKTRYVEYLDSKPGAKKYNKFKRILYGKPDSLVLELFKRIYPKFKDRKSIRILDVGGGDGKRLRSLIDLFRKNGVNARTVLIEPSKAFTDDLKDALKKRKYAIKIFQGKFEDFRSADKYDLILFIHSIYTFKDSGYLKKAKKLSAENSLLTIITNDYNSLLGGLKKITDQEFLSKRRDLRDVEADLEKEKLSYRKSKFNTVFKGILKDGRLTRNGELMLEWLALRDPRLIDKQTKDKAVQVIKKNSKNDIITDREVLIEVGGIED